MKENIYIILTHAIIDIGGGQLYVNSKREYLENKGWKVYIFSYSQGRDIKIDSLRKYEQFIIPELSIYPFDFSKQKRTEVLSRIVRELPDRHDCIIESSSTYLAVWGEILAGMLNGKHINYNINEQPLCPPFLFDFFKFKLDRNELAGIHNGIICNFFRRYLELEENDRYTLKAFYSEKQVDNIPCALLEKIDKKRLTIGVVARLEKPFVRATVSSITSFISRHAELSFNIIYIGNDGANSDIEHYIKSEYEQLNNVLLYLPGSMFPLPQCLLDCFDVAISSSGAVGTLLRAGVKTIPIDVDTNKAIGGVCGIDTLQHLRANGEPLIDVEEILEKVLIQKAYEDVRLFCPSKVVELDTRMQTHMDFIARSEQKKCYFIGFKSSSFFKKIIISIIGYKYYIKLYCLLKSR